MSTSRQHARALAVIVAVTFMPLGRPALAQYDAPTTLSCGLRDARASTGTTLTIPTREPSDVAVLGFRSGGAGSENPYLGQGLAAGVAERLSRIATVRVRSTVPLYWAEPTTVQEVLTVGMESGARYLVAGELRRAPKSFLARVSLYRSADGKLVGTANYDVSLDSLIDLEAQIAVDVARRIVTALSREDLAALNRPVTRSVAAYDRFLLGSSLYSDRTPMSVARAVRVLEAATQADPRFAEAHARRAAAYAEMLAHGWGATNEPAERLVQAGMAAADRAIALDSTSVTAWVARGRLLGFAFPRLPQRAWPSFERALVLAPRSAEAWEAYGRSRLDAGDLAGAEARLLRAAAVDPDRSAALVDVADLSMFRRDFRGACRALNAALTADPWDPFAYALRAMVRMRLSEVRDAWGDAETTTRLGRAMDGQAAMAIVYGHVHDTTSARARIRAYTPPRGVVDTRPLSVWEGRLLALAALAGGDSANAIAFIERVRPRGAPLWMALRDPGFDPLRTDPRFTRLSEVARPGPVVVPAELTSRRSTAKTKSPRARRLATTEAPGTKSAKP